MKLTHYKRINLLFSVFFLLIFTIEALADEKPGAISKPSSLSAQGGLVKKEVEAKELPPLESDPETVEFWEERSQATKERVKTLKKMTKTKQRELRTKRRPGLKKGRQKVRERPVKKYLK